MSRSSLEDSGENADIEVGTYIYLAKREMTSACFILVFIEEKLP